MKKLLAVFLLLGLGGCVVAPNGSHHYRGSSTYYHTPRYHTLVCHYTSYYDRYQRRHVTVRRCH